jgi:hypothetical protein
MRRYGTQTALPLPALRLGSRAGSIASTGSGSRPTPRRSLIAPTAHRRARSRRNSACPTASPGRSSRAISARTPIRTRRSATRSRGRWSRR